MLHKNLAPQDSHSPSQEQVENNTGNDIASLKCVVYTGIGTLYPSVAIANDTDDVRGITQSVIQNGSKGYILVYGITYNIDTSAWPVGTSLFADVNGSLTDVSGGGPQVANVLKQHASLGVIQVTCLDTPAAGSVLVQDTDSIDLDTVGSIVTADLRLSTNAASVNNMKATTTIKASPSKGLHVEYPFATTSQDGVLRATDWTTFNNKVDQNDDRFSSTNILLVKKNPGTGEFLTIEAALATITTSSSTNMYLIKVGAGTFDENPLVVPQYVSIIGASIQTTFVSPVDPTDHLFTLGTGCELSFMSLIGISGSLGSGKAAIYCEDVGDFAQCHKLSIYDFDIGVRNWSNTSGSTVYLEYVDINGDYSYAIWNTSDTGQANRCQAENFYTYGSTSSIKTAILSEGPTSDLLLHVVGLIGQGVDKGVVSRNGGNVQIGASFFQDLDTGVISENTGAGADIVIDGSPFRNCTTNLSILNAGTTGYINGFTEFDKTFIDAASTFFIANKDLKIITVANKGGDFTSIKDAIDSITGQSLTNQYIVSAGPGIFLEDQITGKEFVTLQGNSTTITANNPSIPLLIGADGFAVEDVVFDGVTDAGIPTIYYESTGNSLGSILTLNNIQFGSADTLVHIKGTSYPTIAIFRSPTMGGVNTFDVGFICENSGAGFTQLNIDSLLYQRNFGPYPSKMIAVTGVGSELNLFNSGARNDTPTGTFLEVQDGANIRATSCLISGFDKALHVKNVGVAPIVRFGTGQVDNSGTYDILVEHPGTTGAITGAYDTTKVFVDDASTISLELSDPVNGGAEVVGPLRLGTKNSNITDVTDLIQLSSPSGKLSGGVITNSVNPLDVSVSAGFGYLSDSVTMKLKKVTWPTTIVTLVDNANNFIFIDNTGVPTSSTSLPSLTTTILLSRVRASAGVVAFRAQIPYIANNSSTHLDEFLRTALGPIYVSGSVVTENISTARALDITSGQYWFSRLKFLPVGGTAITYKDFYHISGVFTESPGTVVDNTQYDNGTDLVALTPTYFTKHVLYVAGDNGDETYALVRGQAEYSTLLLAQLGPLPSPPSFFQDITASLVTIIVQEGTPNIIEFTNIQPRIGFQSPSTSASADHGNLLGLGDDDHLQYLLVTGARALTGNLDIGGNSITNVNLVDGIDVTAHAARHNFNGADPLLSAVPQTIGAANLEGTDNSHVSRADHVHAHGNLGGGATHAVATTTVNGYMSATDKVKSDASGILTSSAPINVTKAAAVVGISTESARADHKHDITTAAAAAQAADQVNAEGASTSLARADHIHNIPTGAPVTSTADGSNTQGVATTFAKSDHKHNIATGTPSTQTPDQANAAGVSSNLARADHIHNIPADAPTTTLSPITTNAEGVGTSFARNDHTHAVATGLVGEVVTILPDATAAAGTIDKFARVDHRHAIVTDAPTTTLSPTTTNAEGSGTSFSRNDHTHAISTGSVGDITTILPNDAASAGVVNSFARVDHRHAIAADTAVSISTSSVNAEGASTSFARANHTHAVSITTSRVASTTLITTTSTTYVVMTGQTLTPAAGTYQVLARANVSATSNNRVISLAIHSGGTIIADTEINTFIRTGNALFTAADISGLFTEAFVTVNGSQAIDMRWKTDGGTAQAMAYSLAMIKVG